jgi:hypothetical protein
VALPLTMLATLPQLFVPPAEVVQVPLIQVPLAVSYNRLGNAAIVGIGGWQTGVRWSFQPDLNCPLASTVASAVLM